MPKHPVKLNHPVPAQRDGEGALISIQLRDAGDGKQILQANLSEAPVPARRYVAELAHVVYQRETFSMCFAQQMLGRDDLRNLLVVHMSPSNVVRFLNVINDIQNPSIQEVAEKMGVRAAAATPIDVEPKDTVALAVTAGMVAVSGHDACIDFFSASPFSLGRAQHAQKLAVDPVVRIDLRAALVLSFIEQLRAQIADVPDTLKAE